MIEESSRLAIVVNAAYDRQKGFAVVKLHRNVTVSFSERVDTILRVRATIGPVEILVRPTTKDREPSDIYLILASTEIFDEIELDSAGWVVVPEKGRKDCEHAIEIFSNMVSVCNRVKRSISSIDPAIALSSVPQEVLDALDQSKGFRKGMNARMSAPFSIDLSDASYVDALMDRDEGVALLAETFSTSHAVARFREYVRFFENAFGLPFSQLGKKLSQFLDEAKLGYSRQEVESWISCRDEATHGDLRRSSKLILGRTLRRSSLEWNKRLMTSSLTS